ncbi:hypothetical protein F9C07_2285749 [Aspergillus flavus]|uniref:Uncharacterized protein n=1 Tax=Aspergillus flavus (strain ATCC 200026 / FGSC A1120 / IAM 13836 / NRRL 3357 / JCM 12722 / SRRC 167) TaxID=332952 RepID=A0A7U2N1U4_ASPFN|nr:uncharacterized protein G4B84_010128 [Aspergillus flavus NRRL3357]KAF7621929.1 hypothetical protein AFLA_008479 [Aspergillus flavus NRRL3357]QMW34662.1 hypothetical protein G4B84_010128 [Aspergillus flavus NRRL3357]QRD93515.1 hypothetical protein F9C07_2285749 [Aspergillus flavus]
MSDRRNDSHSSFSSDDLLEGTDSPICAASDTTYDTYDANATTNYGVQGAKRLNTEKRTATDMSIHEYEAPSGTKIKKTNFENGRGRTIYNPSTGAYDEILDYGTDDAEHHHREKLSADGIYQLRDVDLHRDGTRHVHREYNNPIAGITTSVEGTMSGRAFEAGF